jgi:hypothetical protein
MSHATRRRVRRRQDRRRSSALRFAEIAIAIGLLPRPLEREERAVMRLALERVRQALGEQPLRVVNG